MAPLIPFSEIQIQMVATFGHGKSFVQGQFVWLYQPRRNIGLSNKLQKPWEGPYLIVKQINDSIYQIQKSPKSTKRIVHFDRLKEYKGKPIDSWLGSVDAESRLEVRSQRDLKPDDESSDDCESSSADSTCESHSEQYSRPTYPVELNNSAVFF
jgi:hypothetical protein